MSIDLSKTLVFVVPLRPAGSTIDWPAVERALRETVCSIKGSKRQDFLVVIAGHDEPHLGSESDSRVTFLQVPFDAPQSESDQYKDYHRKRRYIGAWLRQNSSGDCRVMLLDADDWVSNRLAAHILQESEYDGFVVTSGYKYDSNSGALAAVRGTFDRSCGSSFVAKFNKQELPLSWEDMNCFFSSLKRHRERRQLSEAAGKKIAEIPFPAVVYRINHAESMETQKRGLQSLKDKDLISPKEYGEIFAEFNMDNVVGS